MGHHTKRYLDSGSASDLVAAQSNLMTNRVSNQRQSHQSNGQKNRAMTAEQVSFRVSGTATLQNQQHHQQQHQHRHHMSNASNPSYGSLQFQTSHSVPPRQQHQGHIQLHSMSGSIPNVPMNQHQNHRHQQQHHQYHHS